LEKHRELFKFLESRRKNISPSGAGEVVRLDWGWYGLIALLSGKDPLKIDKIVQLKIVELLNFYAWLTWQDVRN